MSAGRLNMKWGAALADASDLNWSEAKVEAQTVAGVGSLLDTNTACRCRRQKLIRSAGKYGGHLSPLRFLRVCRKRTRIEQYQEQIIDSQDKQECSRPVLEVKKECGECEIEPNWREWATSHRAGSELTSARSVC